MFERSGQRKPHMELLQGVLALHEASLVKPHYVLWCETMLTVNAVPTPLHPAFTCSLKIWLNSYLLLNLHLLFLSMCSSAWLDTLHLQLRWSCCCRPSVDAGTLMMAGLKRSSLRSLFRMLLWRLEVSQGQTEWIHNRVDRATVLKVSQECIRETILDAAASY